MSVLARRRSVLPSTPRLIVDLARNTGEVEETQRLRYQVFAEEMGAQIGTFTEGLDVDRFDPYCHHLLVRDTFSGEVVACTRFLTDTQARLAGGFYAQTEFELEGLINLPGRVVEMGRTCVRRSHRNGTALSHLWSGVANFMVRNRFEYLIGCASISMRDGGATARVTMENLRDSHRVAPHLRVLPKHCLGPVDYPLPVLLEMPPLIRAYLRWGARVCGEPCWDRAFNVADLLMLLSLDHTDQRYLRRYFEPLGYRKGRSINAATELANCGTRIATQNS